MRWPARSKAASGTIRMSGATSCASGTGSRMPHWPAVNGSPNVQARMTNGLPRPAIAGSASRAPASASLRISGTGLISLFIGEKPETIVPAANFDRKRAPQSPLPPPPARPQARRRAVRAPLRAAFGQIVKADVDTLVSRIGRAKRMRCTANSGPLRWNGPGSAARTRKCGAAMAVGVLIPGTYISRWAPYVRTHEPGQGQLPLGS